MKKSIIYSIMYIRLRLYMAMLIVLSIDLPRPSEATLQALTTMEGWTVKEEEDKDKRESLCLRAKFTRI